MSIFRSEKMGLYHLAMSKESAYEVLCELGDLDSIQFLDQNPGEQPHNRPFAKSVKRCQELEAKVQQILEQAKLYNTEVTPAKDVKGYLQNLRQELDQRDKAPHTYIDDIEAELEKKSQQLEEQIRNANKFQDQVNQLHEYKAVLQQSKETLSEHLYGRQNISLAEDDENKDGILHDLTVNLSYMAGVIETQDLLRFKRMVFRATKGNSWTTSNDIQPWATIKKRPELEEADDDEVPSLDQQPRKASFLIIYPGGSSDTIKNKLTRICDSFRATRYPLPADPSQYMKKMMDIESQILEQSNTMKLTQRAIQKLIREWTSPRGAFKYSWIEEVRLFLIREKALWSNMNLLNIKNEIFDGYYWCPEMLSNDVEQAVRALHSRKVNLPQTTITPKDFKKQTPPTYFQTNEFTGVFQEIVDTYGMARYQEINPGIFCCGMFPVKFGIMFGDIGHGGLLFAAGIALTKYSDTLKANGLEAFAQVRYLILLMGFFAFFSGFIYNDFFSMPLKLFGSCFENVPGSSVTKAIEGCVHPIGLDPKWYIAKNELSFMNSLKMKISVIVGVLQMLWGIILKGMNALHGRNYIDFFFEFVPQIIFLISTFGYMDFMIFKKWSINFEDTSMAPSIISQMINLPLQLGALPEDSDGNKLKLFQDADSQQSLQYNLLIISLICVPVMLLFKPIILFFKSKSKRTPPATTELQESLLNDSEEQLKQNLKAEKAKTEGGHGDHDDDHDIGEIVIHQVIETIEFVLGSISNTASYLRLWALSLAHGQLAKVFFEKTIGGGIESANIVVIFIGFFLFLNITMGVIMAMDCMECFLHALRLQWVEFQNKFYKADGYRFQPFSFHQSIKAINEEAK